MIILGGTYAERCRRPASDRLRGSGVRAAIALRGLADSLELWTCASPSERLELDVVAGAYGLAYTVAERSTLIGFAYFTPLSPPAISGLGARTDANFDAKADTVLRFGMLEAGLAVSISARTLVIDPQSESADLPLEASTYDRLAVVANERETLRLGGALEVEVAAANVQKQTNADAVVAKCGARGAVVATRGTVETVGSFPTERVWPIGSGDIFAAAFAWAYGERGDDALTAARFASRSAAHWCSSPAEPQLDQSYTAAEELPFAPRPVVYIAAPFFGLGQSWLVDLVRDALRELGAAPFSPFHDVGRGGPEVAIADLEGLDKSASVLALLDEFDPGTLFEVGYSIRKGTPVVAYLDPRPAEPLVMLEGSGVEVATDLASATYRAIWRGLRGT